ncbi:MAG: (2Fe-2S)-binding protein [Acidobacteriia bacterium]|nr:(2Fe-2S)-binding protein [Terriglobia bacterium]
MKLSVALNGEQREFDVPANTSLLSLLREEAGCFSVKHGCETGDCGACAVIVDGKVVNTCILLAAQVDEREVITLEGVPWVKASMNDTSRPDEPSEAQEAGPEAGHKPSDSSAASRSSFQNPAAFSREEYPSAFESLHPLQQAFVDAHAIQCGYCTPGMILSSLALFVEKGLIDLPSIKRKTKVTPVKRKPGIKRRPPTEQEVREALAGNLCRCTGYFKPVEAVLRAAEKLVLEQK